MKIRLMFAFNFGISWDPHRRRLMLFLLPLLGVCLEFKGGGKPVLALPPTDDERLLQAIEDAPTALWAELRRSLSDLSGVRVVQARERLFAAGLIEDKPVQFVDKYGQTQSRRVLARTAAGR